LEAYVLINAEPAKLWQVADEVLKIEGVKMAHAVTGPFDVATYIEFTKIEALGRIIQKIQSLTGVRGTQTLISIPRTIRE